ncbi:hypothetical protein [Blautia wexlerae]|jgi:hypothetical protein|uniref:hypothetical protein n=1 Tax=Blautia wexlerae TaxID=418240 RepID=UPI0018A0D047|nr:hypothetical protein [Blautia wexlerae]
MSKEKTLRISEETEVMQTTGVPAQEIDGVGVVMATEIIADLKKQLEEAKGNAKVWEENWNVCHDYNMVLSRQSDIISYILKLDNIRSLDMIWGCVRTSYEYQIKKEQEAENDGEV